MVGRLNLQDVPDLLDIKKRGERVLDSPDSGLPPSPSPSNWHLSGGGGEKGSSNGHQEPESPPRLEQSSPLPPTPLSASFSSRLCPLSFGEGVEFDPLPPKEIRYTSSVKYDSEKHFIDNVLLPVGLGVSACSQRVICIPDCTWRSYRAEVHFEPRNKPQRYLSTTIVYPKHTTTVYTTTLDYNCRKSMRRFLSSVELENAEYPEEC
ncbi:refilin-B [Ambystoma mexicanum]|uniref:refilin-B n=1 Tax=Ambystoma mexicanum TaxID=8296 RepID=UPI0037E7BFF6